MTTTPTHAPGTSALDRLFATLRRSSVHRSATDRHIGGVCGGLAAAVGLSPTIVRLATIGLALFGIGVPVYLVAWLLLPDQNGSLHLERALRQGAGGSIVLLVFTVLALIPEPRSHQVSGWVVAAIALVALAVRRTHNRPQPPMGSQPPTWPQDAPRS